MKKVLAAVITMVFITAATQAQFKIGIKAGAGLSNQHSNVASGTKLAGSEAFRGYHAGLVADAPLSDHLSLQPQLLYSRKGAKYTNAGSAYETTFSTRNIELSTNLVYKVNTSFGKIFAGAGPTIGYSLSGELEQNGHSDKLYTGDLKDWKHIDIGAGATAGVEFNNGLFAGINYQMGLLDINKSAGADTKNRSISMSVGYMIDWNKLKRRG